MDTTELKQAAEKATPGPWTWEPVGEFDGQPSNAGGFTYQHIRSGYKGVADTYHASGMQCPDGSVIEPRNGNKDDADFIALANPSTILALIAENESLKASRRVYELDNHHNALMCGYCSGPNELRETGDYEWLGPITAESFTPAVVATHRCNGNPTPHHGTQNKCTVCGEYRNGWYDPSGMEVLRPTAPAAVANTDCPKCGTEMELQSVCEQCGNRVAVVEPAATSRITVEGIPNRCAKCGDVLTCCLGCKDNEIEDAREAIVKLVRAKAAENVATDTRAQNLMRLTVARDIESTPLAQLMKGEV